MAVATRAVAAAVRIYPAYFAPRPLVVDLIPYRITPTAATSCVGLSGNTFSSLLVLHLQVLVAVYVKSSAHISSIIALDLAAPLYCLFVCSIVNRCCCLISFLNCLNNLINAILRRHGAGAVLVAAAVVYYGVYPVRPVCPSDDKQPLAELYRLTAVCPRA